MIYLCVGGGSKNKNSFIKKIAQGQEIILIPNSSNRELIIETAFNVNIFGELPVFILDNILNREDSLLSLEDLEILKNSNNKFIFCEDILNKTQEKKYSKFIEKIERFENKKIKKPIFNNNFIIVDAFAKKNKIETWILYLKTINSGVSPEAIIGMFFWKIKNMIISDSKIFSKKQLKNFSKELIDLYHQSHKGEKDMVVGLEQFILRSLS